MNNKVKYAVMFIVGATLGAAGGYTFAKKKYEMIADEEIASAKEAFNETNENLNNKLNQLSEQAAEQLIADKGESPMEYASKFKPDENPVQMDESVIKGDQIDTIFEKYGSRKIAEKPVNRSATTPYVGSDPIYVITPDEYGDLEDYNLVSLTLTKDGYLLDDQNELIDDPSGAIGDSLIHMGEYEDDAVHVRNDVRQCDYEILQDLRNLSEILGG